MVEPAKHYDLFISYAGADRAWVEGYLLESLRQSGVNALSEAAFVLGAPRLLEFERAIQQSQRTLLVISPAYLADGFNEFVGLLGQSYGFDTQTWPVIPVILQSVSLPPRLSALVRLDATNPDEWEDAIERLCNDLKRTVSTPSARPACPYPGMVPFNEALSDRFFGREQEIQELLQELRLNPFITVIGPSGSGKSSLVFAGLISKLRQTSLFGVGDWHMLSMRPGETPLTTLKSLLPGDSNNPTQFVEQVLVQQPETQQLLLVIDQFEELFTLSKDEAVPFQESLVRLSEMPNCYVVLTVRADFYPDLMTCPLWSKIQVHRMEVVPLDNAGLRQAILKPAEAVGVFIEPALLERLVEDAAGEPGVLPLIQETLVLLWERIERRFLPLRVYQALVLTRESYGGIQGGQRTGLQVAIARRADAALANLQPNPEVQRAISRRIFLRLVQFGEGRADTRRQQSVDALRAAGDDFKLFQKTLAHLANCRLLTLSGEEQDAVTRRVDISHEALIVGWPQLQQWITERREAEQTRRRLATKVDEWVRLGRSAGGLLDKVELAEAQRWLESLDAINLGYDQSLAELITASETAIKAAEEHELRLIQAQLQQEQKARKAAQSRNQILVSGIAILLVLTGFAVYQAINARIQTLQAMVSASETLAVSNKKLNALAESLKTGRYLQKTLAGVSLSNQLKILLSFAKIAADTQEINSFNRHTNQILSVSFSPDGQMIAAADLDGVLKLWKPDGSLVKTIQAHDRWINSLSFSPNGQFIATVGEDKVIKLWKSDGTFFKDLPGHSDWVLGVSFSPNSQMLASSSKDGTIKIWRIQDGQLLTTLKGHQGSITCVSFSPDGKWLASGGEDQMINLWQVDDRLSTIVKGSSKVLKGHLDLVSSISFSPNSQLIASSSLDKSVLLWKVDGTLVREFQQAHQDNVLKVRFSPDGLKLASASVDRTIKVWKLDGTLLDTLEGHSDAVRDISFSSDGKILVSASLDHTVKLWPLNNAFQGHRATVTNVGFSPITDNLIASADSDGVLILWNKEGKLLKTIKAHTGFVSSVSFSPDGQRLVSSGEDQTIKLWTFRGELVKALKDHQSVIKYTTFSSTGKLIASAGEDGKIKLWDREGTFLQSIDAHQDWVNRLSFSADDRLIASASSDTKVKLWKKEGQQYGLVKTLNGHIGSVIDVVISPNGNYIASISEDKNLRFWGQDGTLVKSVAVQTESTPIRISFYPENDFLVLITDDGTTQIWRTTGELIQTIQGPRHQIFGVSISPDWSKVVLITSERSLVFWHLNLENLLVASCQHLHNYLKNGITDYENTLRCE